MKLENFLSPTPQSNPFLFIFIFFLALRFTLWQTVLLCGIECQNCFSFLLSQYVSHHAVNVAETA